MSDLSPLFLSVLVACTSTALIFPFGVVLAWRLAHGRRFRGQGVIETLLALPLVLPPTVVGYYLLSLLGRGTPFGSWVNDVLGLHLIFTWQGAALAASVMAFPLLLRSSQTAFAGVDSSLLEAGRTLGASEYRLLTSVVVPLSSRGIMGGVALALARSLGEFGATLMVAGSIPGRTQTMTLALYAAISGGHDREAFVLTVVLSLTAAVLLGMVSWLGTWGHRST